MRSIGDIPPQQKHKILQNTFISLINFPRNILFWRGVRAVASLAGVAVDVRAAGRLLCTGGGRRRCRPAGDAKAAQHDRAPLPATGHGRQHPAPHSSLGPHRCAATNGEKRVVPHSAHHDSPRCASECRHASPWMHASICRAIIIATQIITHRCVIVFSQLKYHTCLVVSSCQCNLYKLILNINTHPLYMYV